MLIRPNAHTYIMGDVEAAMKSTSEDYGKFRAKDSVDVTVVAMEEWKVPRHPYDLPDWEFSTFGNVRLEFTKKPVKVLINGGRRRFRYMSFDQNGKRRKYITHNVANVVLSTFKAPPAGDTCVVEHIDGDNLNDHIDNLRWTTRSLLLKKSLKK